ncbi:hypothetical protein J2T17_001981 [Paenibacillus mucilaginosus]|uniref:hypothetical protein n=1 Tax=Paenibacillus mucilaginosus TaxID=61624 RepID=UPI003D1B85F6
MKKNVIIRWLNVAGLLAVLVLNYLANALPLNNLTTSQISAMFPVRNTPASYAFSIWGLIYALLVGRKPLSPTAPGGQPLCSRSSPSGCSLPAVS